MRACVMAASSAATCCCWRPSAAALPGEARWFASDLAAADLRHFFFEIVEQGLPVPAAAGIAVAFHVDDAVVVHLHLGDARIVLLQGLEQVHVLLMLLQEL